MIQSSRVHALIIGCLAGMPAGAGETTTFTYDALGRLVQAQISGGVMHGVQQGFQYDAAGNRTQLQTAGATTPMPTMITPSRTTLNVMGGNSAALTLYVGDTSASGTVSFSINDVFVGSAQVVNGVVQTVLQGVTAGNYTLRAIYTGDTNNEPTTATFNVKIQDLSWLPVVIDLILAD